MENPGTVWARGEDKGNEVGCVPVFPFSFTILPQAKHQQWHFVIFFPQGLTLTVGLLCFPEVKPSQEEHLLGSILRVSWLSQGKRVRPSLLTSIDLPLGLLGKGELPKGGPEIIKTDEEVGRMGSLECQRQPAKGAQAVCKQQGKGGRQRQAERQGPQKGRKF